MMEQSVTKKIAKNFSWLLVGNIASGLINFFTIIYVARVLGAAAFGLFQFVQAFLLYLVIIVDSGLSTYGMREIAQDRSRAAAISINILALRLLIALVTFCLSLILLLIIPIPPMIRLLFIVTFLLIFYRALNTDWIFQGLEKMEYLAVSKLLFSATTFFFMFIFVKGPGDLVRIPLIQFLFGLVIALAFLLLLFTRFFRLDLKQLTVQSWPKAFMIAIPLGVSTIFLQIYDNLDTIMLGLMAQPAIVGIYNAAYRMFYLFAGVFSLWLATVLPVVCKRISEDNARAKVFLEKFMSLTLLLMIPITLLGALSAPLLIKIFFGDEYVQAIPALRILVWVLIPLAVSNTYGCLVLIPAGLFNQFLVSVGAGALANVILNVILIPKFSYLGAAVATLIAQVVAGIFAFNLSKNVLRIGFSKYLSKPLIISLISYCVFFMTYYLLPGQLPSLRVFISSLAFVGAASLMITYIEKEFIFSFIKEIIRR